MNNQSYQDVRALFDAALEQPAEERALFLARQCNGNQVVRSEVEALLAAHARTDNPLDKHAFNDDWEAQPEAGSAPQTGRRLGAYRVIRELGRGGMATVYLAERADDLYQMRVAVKLLDRAWSWTETELLFQQERQILARLAHPNIARLLDAGTSDEGLSYLVMEYVEGQPIHHYCRERSLTLPGRLQLFLKVCEAVASAHRNLVIHRDLKPSNILVTPDGQPKLLDFGIAKLLESNERTLTGLHRMTPQYASPEQVRGEAVTTASDVYSLGVLLYQLLTERLPYRADAVTPLQMSRAVVEEEPLRPRTLNPKLAGDLEAILLKALRKEPERRYPSVDGLHEEIERYLEGLPVKARRGTFSYRAGKFLRRHTTAVVAGALIAAALAVTAGTAVRSARIARSEADRNERLLYTVHIKAAAEAWEAGDSQRAIEQLELGRPRPGRTDLRNFEWFLLWNLTHPKTLRLSGMPRPLREPLFFSPHNRLIASANENNSVEIFDAAGRWLRTLRGHSDKVDAVAFSADGSLLATGSKAKTVVVWETATGRVLQTLGNHVSWVQTVSFSPEGQRLASVEYGQVKLWDWKSGKLLKDFRISDGRCESIDFSPDGRMLAGGTLAGPVLLWDTNSGKEVGKLLGGSPSIRSLDFSPDGRQLAAASASGTIQVWDVAKRVLLFSLNRHSGSVESLAYAPDGSRFASIAEREVLLWNSATGQVLAEFMGPGTPRGSLSFSASGKRLTASGREHTVREWDVDQACALQTLSGLRDRTEQASFSPDSRTLLTASRGGGVNFWETETGRLAGHLPVRGRFAEVSPNGKHLAIGITDGVVLLYSFPPGEAPLHQLNTKFHRVISVAFSPDSRLLAIRGDHPIAQVWDLGSHELAANLLHDERVKSVVFSPSGQEFDVIVTSLSFSPDGQTLATGSQDGFLRLWTQAGKQFRILRAQEGGVNAIGFASATRIITAGQDGLIKVWDLLTGNAVLTYKRQLPYVSRLAISPDGKRLASTSDHDVRIWELETGIDLLSLKPDIRQVQTLAFSPDGLCLAAAGIDGDVRIWRASTEESSAAALRSPR
ncbi:MAG: serine/threonine protein kinase [Acidobacteria bacterium]|nr:serine/threonine protein kinase [Acidobacteriota bacterium]